jgi:hypothetical protein
MRRGLKNHYLWSKFFSGISKKRYGIYTHSKNPRCVNRQSLLKGTHVKNCIPTEWGDVSLVEATLELFKTAVQDGCDYVLLVSDTCIPIQSFNYVHRQIFRDNRTRLWLKLNKSSSKPTAHTYFDGTETERRYAESWAIRGFVELKDFIKGSQWVGVKKSDLEILLQDDSYIENFDDVFAADEHFVPTILNKYGDMDSVLSDRITFAKWDHAEDWRHPVEYRWLTREDIHEAKSSGAFFMRKVLMLSNANCALSKYGTDTFKIPSGKNYISYVHIPKNGGCSIKKFFSADARFFNHAHSTAAEIKEALGTELWEETYTFATVRNPWARTLSAFTFLQAGGLPQFNDSEKALALGILPDTYFNEWVMENEDNFFNPAGPFCGTPGWMHFGKQVSYLNTPIDCIFKLEELSQDTPKPFMSPLPLDNSTDHGSYADTYNAYSKGIVGAAYKDDIEEFGYSF